MKKHNGLLARLIRRGINAKYSLPTWLWVIVSFIVGVLTTGYAFASPATFVLFLSGLPLNGMFIGPVVVIAGIVTMFGMAKYRPTLVKYGSFASFCAWIPITYAFYIAGGWINVALLPIWMLLFWSYKYLASHIRERDGS